METERKTHDAIVADLDHEFPAAIASRRRQEPLKERSSVFWELVLFLVYGVFVMALYLFVEMSDRKQFAPLRAGLPPADSTGWSLGACAASAEVRGKVVTVRCDGGFFVGGVKLLSRNKAVSGYYSEVQEAHEQREANWLKGRLP